MNELTISAVEVEAVRGPAGRFPYPVLSQVVPLDIYLAQGQSAGAPPEPDPEETVEALYLRITTRQGPEGLYGPVDATAAWPVTQILAPFLIGQNALAHATLWDKMQRLDRHSRHGHIKLGISAVDNALWDLRGRAFDAPVWQLLGGSGRELFEKGRDLYEKGREIAEEAAEMFERGRRLAEKKIDESI